MSTKIDEIEKEMDEEPRYNRRVAVQFELLYKGHKGKEMDPNSEVHPDMTLSVRQLLARHTRGMGLPPDKEPLYFDIEIPNIKDITDVEEYKTHLENTLEQTKKFIEDEYNRKQERESTEGQRGEEDIDKNVEAGL